MNTLNHNVEIYILLTFTGTRFANAIKTFTKTEYPHVSLGLNKELTELYSFGRKKPTNPFDGGFVEEGITKGVFGYYKNTVCRVYSLQIPYCSYVKLKENISKMIGEKEKYKYSYLGLVGIMLNTPIERENELFCSQFVSQVLDEVEIHLFNKPCSLVKPADFLDIKGTKLIYEGKLSEYPYHVSLTEMVKERDDKIIQSY